MPVLVARFVTFRVKSCRSGARRTGRLHADGSYDIWANVRNTSRPLRRRHRRVIRSEVYTVAFILARLPEVGGPGWTSKHERHGPSDRKLTIWPTAVSHAVGIRGAEVSQGSKHREQGTDCPAWVVARWYGFRIALDDLESIQHVQ